MKRIAWVLLAAASALGACQGYDKGVEVICQAPNTCLECANVDPSMKMAMLAASIEQDLGNGKAKDLFASLAVLSPAERGAKLAAEAKAEGLASCPLADLFAQMAAEP